MCDGLCDEVLDPESVLYHHSIRLQRRLPGQPHGNGCVVVYSQVTGRGGRTWREKLGRHSTEKKIKIENDYLDFRLIEIFGIYFLTDRLHQCEAAQAGWALRLYALRL